MNKKLMRVFAIGATLLVASGSLVGCKTPESNGPGSEIEIDESRSQLYVYNFAGGFGSEWLTQLALEYEALHKNDVYEQGTDKVGIQIVPSNIKNSVKPGTVKSSKEVLYFVEEVDYQTLLNNDAVKDITAAVTGENPYETDKTLYSKLYDDQAEFLGRGTGDDTKYYAYPHYLTTMGIVYDIDLFEENGYYFAETPWVPDDGNAEETFLGLFVQEAVNNTQKSKGPDGRTGVIGGVDYSADDGLPATYEQFFQLCTYINMSNNAILWAGAAYNGYLTWLTTSLAADYEGYAQMRLNYTFDGTATELVKLDDNGKVVYDNHGNPVTESKNIGHANGYDVKRQAGKYYSLNFLETLFNQDYIKNDDSHYFSDTFSHLDAQETFLKSAKESKQYAMLIDGSWWESEASSVFTEMGAGYSRNERNLGWMPLPRANQAKVDAQTNTTVIDQLYPFSFVANTSQMTDWQYEAAIDFLQFINTDASLAKFTQITGCPKVLKYEIEDTEYEAMSTFTKSLYDHFKKSDIVVPYHENALFVNNQTTFSVHNGGFWYSKARTEKNPPVTLNESRDKDGIVTITGKSFFEGMYARAKELTIWSRF